MEIWYFTFGYGQKLRAFTGNSTDGLGDGVPLDNGYVAIRAEDAAAARAAMVRLFGFVWCDQYTVLPQLTGLEWRDLSVILPEAVRAR